MSDRNNFEWPCRFRQQERPSEVAPAAAGSRKCPTCGKLLEKVTYPGGYLNREQWGSQRAGDFVCRECPDNGRAANKRFAYFWESEVANPENNPAQPPR